MQSALSCMKRDGTSLMIAFPWGRKAVLQCIEDFKKSSLKYGGRFYFMAAPDEPEKIDQDGFLCQADVIQSSGEPPLTRTSPRSSVSNEQLRELEQESEKILQAGACGFGEIFFYHLMGTLDDGGDFCTPADSPAMLLLADVAARHDVPMDVHMDLIDEDVAVPP